MTTDVKKLRHEGTVEEKVIVPAVDIYETENEYVVKADMPGVTKENVNIIFNDNVLEINGAVEEGWKEKENLKYNEFSLCNYHRSFKVGNDIDSEKINASMGNGVLTLELPKKEAVKPRKIQINVS
jgi:HSP20 family protein